MPRGYESGNPASSRPHAAWSAARRYPSRVTDQTNPYDPPAEISELVKERTEARAKRDWTRADAIKAQIEAAGWVVADRGRRSSARPAAPPTVEVNGERRYGSAADVPSALEVPATAAATVVTVASEDPARLSRLLAALRAHSAAGTQVVVVANDPSDAQATALEADAPDRFPIAGRELAVLRTSVRLGYAAALDIALRRVEGEIVVLADGSAVPVGDALTPLALALADPDVAVAGGFGLAGDEDGGPFRPNGLARVELEADEPAADVAALEGAWLAFRREDLAALGLLDEHFVTPSWLDVWLSLRLRVGADGFGEGLGAEESPEESSSEVRDGVEGVETETESDSDRSPEVEGEAPEEAELPAARRALLVRLPLEREDTVWPPDRTRLNRRQMYRVLDAFGWRDDLA